MVRTLTEDWRVEIGRCLVVETQWQRGELGSEVRMLLQCQCQSVKEQAAECSVQDMRRAVPG